MRTVVGGTLLIGALAMATVFGQSRPARRAATAKPYTTWSSYLGGAHSSQFSALSQINKTTVSKLEVVWSYPTGDRQYLFNPIVVGNVMYVLAKSNSIVALDAATGTEIWDHPNMGAVGARGINYWESSDRADRRLLFLNGGMLTAINAATGETVTSFGEAGKVDLRAALDRDTTNIRPLQTSNPGRVFGNLIIVSLPAQGAGYESTPGDVQAYDVRSGRLVWVFHSIPRPGEFGSDSWPTDAGKTAGGVHNWNEMTVDEARGIAYIPFGTARYDFYGADRPGNNLFGNSLVALDARTGKRLWHFQMIHHDLWDWDLPAAPKLLTLHQNGRTIDAVAQPTKHGFVFVFDRVTGKPIWPIEERPVPKSDMPGEHASPTQPFPTKPAPFARQQFTERDINPFLPKAEQDAIRERLKGARNEGLFTPPSLRGTIEMPGHNGGANWGSSGVDPIKGELYVVSKELPTTIKLVPGDPGAPPAGRGRGTAAPADVAPDYKGRFTSPIDFMLSSTNLSMIGPPWSRLTAYDLNTGEIKWQVANGTVKGLPQVEGVDGDTGAHWPRGGVLVTGGGLVFVGTGSDRTLRAYDRDNGTVVWSTTLPAASDGVPATYEVNGRQYLVMPVASGSGYQAPKLGGTPLPVGAGAYVVFAVAK